ncbi:hypothetical protein [Planotetraspora kaengkrachanensis]|uniref:hypothetical protein n=1 Tax=Planotetraspora kaengkrachanensis TaxID=575193 RepID=UPI00194241C4|nr:hypothetical protein [Planotetraspora kaengkrachanensis]
MEAIEVRHLPELSELWQVPFRSSALGGEMRRRPEGRHTFGCSSTTLPPRTTTRCSRRAGRKVQATERPNGADREQREVVSAFLAAARGGDFEGLLRVLDPEVRLTVDTPGGLVVTLGATKVAAGAQLAAGAATLGRAALVGGLPGVVSWREDGTPLSVLAFTVTDGRITAITAVVDPSKLAQMDPPDPA